MSRADPPSALAIDLAKAARASQAFSGRGRKGRSDEEQTRPALYTLRQVCNEMHDFYRQANIKELQRLCFRAASFPELAMPPREAYEALVANNVDYVPLDQIKGRG
jgi:hypothetical protein